MSKMNLLKQHSLCLDQEVKNKSGKVVHIVVKNSPFTLTFGLSEEADLHNYNLDVKLLYDAYADKEVDFVKDKPIGHKLTLNQEGNKLTVEVRIKVLTSQLEDMLFKIGVFATDSNNKIHFSGQSEAIRVISKSDQVKKKEKPATSTPKKRAAPEPTVIEQTSVPPETLAQIETRLNDYNNMLKHMVDRNKKLIDSAHQSKESKEKKSQTVDFPTAFTEFLNVLNVIPTHEERRAKVRRVMATTPASLTSSVTELSDLFMAEGFSRELGNVRQPQSMIQLHQPIKHEPLTLTCNCVTCPYKKELRHIEEFYEDIFFHHNG